MLKNYDMDTYVNIEILKYTSNTNTRNIEYYQSYLCIVKVAKGQVSNISPSIIK